MINKLFQLWIVNNQCGLMYHKSAPLGLLMVSFGIVPAEVRFFRIHLPIIYEWFNTPFREFLVLPFSLLFMYLLSVAIDAIIDLLKDKTRLGITLMYNDFLADVVDYGIPILVLVCFFLYGAPEIPRLYNL